MEIYCRGYRPFIMGGNVRYTVKCEVEADGPHDLGKGFTGYIVTTPDGRTLVAETTSGGTVGPSLESVRADIAEGDVRIMSEQIQLSQKEAMGATKVTPEEFWKDFPEHLLG